MSESSWRLQLAGPAARDIEQLPERYATAIAELLPTLATDPRRIGKPLRFELEGKWVARRGPYRVIYSLEEEPRLVTVLAVAHRADAYRPR
ncbi:MAG TPA: type II toxin-antitoxin system RelE/ParE family toxin [Solirubrobacterales bacterium]|nr:type II toxin-antitoxin system RelE/ParE family toxin [Solirubrobacterales bacterium]